MEDEIMDILEIIGYPGAIKDDSELMNSVRGADGGAKNINYTELVSWITYELSELSGMDEKVNKTLSPDDHSSFMMELSSFLKEIGCNHTRLTEGTISTRLATEENRLLLLIYLLGELQAARMISATQSKNQMKMEFESEPAKDLKALLVSLQFGKPPPNITPKQMFSKVHDKVKMTLSKAHPGLISEPLFCCKLSDKQWIKLEQIQAEMNAEYELRRQMLIKRLDVTIQSFQWSERAKTKENELTEAFRKRRNRMLEKPDVSVGSLLAARADIAVLEKTSNASVRRNTQTKLNKVIIGKVPDRGGRTDEVEPPPKEMPSWTKRTDAPSDRGGFRGRGHQGGQRGGYHQGGGSGFSSSRVQGGGWNQNDRQHHNGNSTFHRGRRGRY